MVTGPIAPAADPQGAGVIEAAQKALPDEPWDLGTWGRWTDAVKGCDRRQGPCAVSSAAPCADRPRAGAGAEDAAALHRARRARRSASPARPPDNLPSGRDRVAGRPYGSGRWARALAPAARWICRLQPSSRPGRNRAARIRSSAPPSGSACPWRRAAVHCLRALVGHDDVALLDGAAVSVPFSASAQVSPCLLQEQAASNSWRNLNAFGNSV